MRITREWATYLTKRGAVHSSHRIPPVDVRRRCWTSWSSWVNVSVMGSQYLTHCSLLAKLLGDDVLKVTIEREQLDFNQVSSHENVDLLLYLLG